MWPALRVAALNRYDSDKFAMQALEDAMPAETNKLTIRLPRQDIEFAKAYARAHSLTVTEVIGRYLRQLRMLEGHSPASALEAITGLVAADVDAAGEFRRQSVDKHGSRS